MIYVLGISGGKDSTALWSWAKRTGLEPRRAVANATKWEASFPGANWDEHMAELAAAIGEPLTITPSEGFAERVRRSGTFPGILNRRWCTQELKLQPMRVELDRIREQTGDDVTMVVGVRADESDERSKMTEREWSDFYDCEVWRPLLRWTVEQVFEEINNAGLPISLLYRLGAERHGCWPCIRAGKLEIRLVAEHDPARIDDIHQLEVETGTTMFCLERPKKKGQERKLIPTPIHEMVKWAQTERGGHRLMLPMFREPTGCARWGLCELPIKDEP